MTPTLCYRAPGTRALPRIRGGQGLFAVAPQPRGTLLVVFRGALYDWPAFQELPQRERSLSIQVAERALLVPRPVCDADYLNHSCQPNAGLTGPCSVVALRDIAAGEEICYDYAMSDTLPYDDFVCACRSAACRGRITCEDWQRPELQQRYAGSFAPHVQRLIEATALR